MTTVKIPAEMYEEFTKFKEVRKRYLKKYGKFISVKVSGPILIERLEQDLLKALTRYIEYYYRSKKIGTYSGILPNTEPFDHKEWPDIDHFENMLYDMYTLMYNEKTGKFEGQIRSKRLAQLKQYEK